MSEMSEMSVIRVLVVEDHPVVRRAVCALLSGDPILNVVCETADGEQAVQKAEEFQPDLILMDISCPESAASKLQDESAASRQNQGSSS